MRTGNKSKLPNYEAISRRSMQREFKRDKLYTTREKTPEIKKKPEISSERRILFVNQNSSYYRYRTFLTGRLVRIIRESCVGGYICEFVHDDDRQALNRAAGWSDMKKEYLLDSVKFK